MAAWTLEFAKTQLETWLKADLAVAQGQSYSVNLDGVSRSFTRADAGKIQERILFWKREVERLEKGSGSPRVRLVVPR